MSKLIVVLGATGLQGGSVISSLLNSPSGTYTIHGISRDPSSAASQALVAKGVEVVPGDLGSVDSLTKAFEGAYAVLGVTMPFTPLSETVQGKNNVDACLSCGVELLVWSSLPDTKVVSNGRFTKITHWDEKAAVDAYIREQGMEAVVLPTGGFVENIHTFHYLRPSPSTPGGWVLAWPVIHSQVNMAMSYISSDFGACVVKSIDIYATGGEGREKLMKRMEKGAVVVCSFEVTIEQMVQTIKRVTGKEVEYVHIPSFPGQEHNEELSEMLQMADEGLNYQGVAFPPEGFVSLGVEFHSFEDYVTQEWVGRMSKA